MLNENPTFIEKAKKKIRKNRTELVAVMAGAGAIATAYFYGKTKGEHNFELEINYWATPAEKDLIHQDKLTSRKP